jgi:hypothetical protein
LKEASSARIVDRAHIERRSYQIVESGPHRRRTHALLASLNGGEAEEAFRTEPESPAAMEVTRAMGRMLVRTAGTDPDQGRRCSNPPLIRGLNVPA